MAAVRWPWQTWDSAAVVSWVGAVPGVLKINNKGLEYYLCIGDKERDKQKGERDKCVHALRNVCYRFACGALIPEHGASSTGARNSLPLLRASEQSKTKSSRLGCSLF